MNARYKNLFKRYGLKCPAELECLIFSAINLAENDMRKCLLLNEYSYGPYAKYQHSSIQQEVEDNLIRFPQDLEEIKERLERYKNELSDNHKKDLEFLEKLLEKDKEGNYIKKFHDKPMFYLNEEYEQYFKDRFASSKLSLPPEPKTESKENFRFWR